jgi:hypothetical protein
MCHYGWGLDARTYICRLRKGQPTSVSLSVPCVATVLCLPLFCLALVLSYRISTLPG